MLIHARETQASCNASRWPPAPLTAQTNASDMEPHHQELNFPTVAINISNRSCLIEHLKLETPDVDFQWRIFQVVWPENTPQYSATLRDPGLTQAITSRQGA
jgi:hypothetical protein